MRRAAWIVAGLAAVVLVGIGAFLWLIAPLSPSYDPVVATSALASCQSSMLYS